MAHHEGTGIARFELGVLYAVVLGVHMRVLDGRGNVVHADDLRGMGFRRLGQPLCRHQTDGSRAAVGVQRGFAAGEFRHLYGQAVQHLGLHGIHLVERMRGNAEGKPAQLVDDEPWAVERFLFVAQDHVGLAGVHVLHDGGHIRAAFHQFAAEVARPGEFLAVGNQGNQHLARAVAYAHHRMANEAGARVFIVGFHAVTLHKLANGQNHALGLLVFDKAIVGGNNTVRAGGVHAA